MTEVKKAKKDKAQKKHVILEYVFITLGVICTSFSFAFFLDPIDLVTGGVGGLAITFSKLTNMDSYILILSLNVVLLIIGWIVIGRDFFNKTFYGSIMYPIVIALFALLYKVINNALPDLFQNLHKEHMFIGVMFGACLTGFGLGITLRYGGSTGGSEIPQKILYEKLAIPYSLSLIFVDGFVLLVSLAVFRNFINLLYGIFYILVSGFITDAIVFSGFSSRTVHIVSDKPEQIKKAILENLNRGVTEFDVQGGFSSSHKKMLVCVLNSSDFYRLKQLLELIDPDVFYYVTRTSEVSGEGFTYGKKIRNKLKKDK